LNDLKRDSEMTGRTMLIACTVIWTQVAFAQDAKRIIRQIAPDRFQPYLRDNNEPRPEAAAVIPPSKERPLGGCDRASRNWIICLRATADLSAMMVEDAQNKLVASLEQRPNLNPSLQRIFAKDLVDADAKWLELRQQECNQLAMLEAGPGRQLFEAQLLCQLTRNAERIDALSAHYGYTAPNPAVTSAQ
jgi:hypothetical protein